MTPRLVWLVFGLPLVGFLGAIGLAEAQRAGAPRYELRIEGYNPRDLVRGNYLLYRFVHEETPASSESLLSNDHEEVACLRGPANGQAGQTLALHRRSARPAGCSVTLPATFVRVEHRFYVQEDKAQQLERAVLEGRATVVVVLPSNSEPAVEKLLIDGNPSSAVTPSD